MNQYNQTFVISCSMQFWPPNGLPPPTHTLYKFPINIFIFKTWLVWYTFYPASDWLPHNNMIKLSVRSCVCKVWEEFSRSGLTQDIQMGSCVFQYYVPYQWIAQQVGSIMGLHVMSCICGMAFECGSTLAKVPLVSRHHRHMTSDV